MSAISSQSIGRTCRSVKHKFVYGKALTYVPKSSVQLYPFRVMYPEPLQKVTVDSLDVAYSIQYVLVDTDEIVYASNPGASFVLQGNNVVLTENIGFVSGEKTYEVHCECSQGQFAMVIEPSMGMLYPSVSPNFTGCDDNGFPYTLKDFLKNTSCLNGRCAGTLAVLDKEYFPLRARYQGGEVYVDVDSGKKRHREPGELRYSTQYDTDGKILSHLPLYYIRRELVLDESTYYYKRREYTNDTTGDLPTYLNSPYLYQYVDGTDCAFSMPPVFNLSRGSGYSTEAWHASVWKVTDDPHKAQLNYDLFLCPKQAEHESIMPGALVAITKETYATNSLPVKNANFGFQMNENGSSIGYSVTVPYFQVEPPVSHWFVALDGQVKTEGVRYVRDLFMNSSEERICSTILNVLEKVKRGGLVAMAAYFVEGFSPTEVNILTNFLFIASGATMPNGTIYDAMGYYNQESRVVSLVLHVFMSEFRQMSPDFLSVVSEGYLAHSDFPVENEMRPHIYHDSFLQFNPEYRMFCGSSEQNHRYFFSWFKYILMRQMSVLAMGDEDLVNTTQHPIVLYGKLVRHIIRRSAQVIAEELGEHFAKHSTGDELILLDKDCTIEPGHTHPEYLVRCNLQKETTAETGTPIVVEHNKGVTGKPDFVYLNMVVNQKEMQPCRGCFTTMNKDLVRFANLFTLACQNDFGVPVDTYVFENKTGVTHVLKKHYMIERKLIDAASQKYELVLVSTVPYKHRGEMMSYLDDEHLRIADYS